MLLGMIFRLYGENFVEIQALFPEILRFEFVTLFVKHPVYRSRYPIGASGVASKLLASAAGADSDITALTLTLTIYN